MTGECVGEIECPDANGGESRMGEYTGLESGGDIWCVEVEDVLEVILTTGEVRRERGGEVMGIEMGGVMGGVRGEVGRVGGGVSGDLMVVVVVVVI
jgi:hypothetical protein